MRTRTPVLALVTGGVLALTAAPTYAHGFGERYDLPVPLNYFLVGAAATVALSFVVIAFFVRRRPRESGYATYDLLRLPGARRILTNPVFTKGVKAQSVGLFGLVIAAALFGSVKPIENLSPTFVWIIWWVGMGYISALVGNVWALINPWKIVFGWGEWLFGVKRGHREAAMFRYPERWDVWPALVLFLIFAWLENVYSGRAVPAKLGLLILAYSVVTWGGMVAFGKHEWLRRGEAFSVLFGFFARFSPTEVRVADERLCTRCGADCDTSDNGCVDCYECFEMARPDQRQVNLRPYAVGLAHPGRVSTATAVFVVLALATVTFDGLTATSEWASVQNAFNGVATADTVGLVMLPLIFLLVYLAFSSAIRHLGGEQASIPEVARAFVFSLVPIALAYNMAHFLSLLVTQGQLIIPLASDPFGFGWDTFRTADYDVNIAVINAKFVWFMSVAAIVLGHIISVYIAHLISLRRTPDHSRALRGQLPMLALMVGYTATSLWIIAQPIVA